LNAWPNRPQSHIRSCVRISNGFLLLLGGAMCGGSLYASTIVFGSIAVALTYAVAAIGGALFAVSAAQLEVSGHDRS
jgi:hypothetical protein